MREDLNREYVLRRVGLDGLAEFLPGPDTLEFGGPPGAHPRPFLRPKQDPDPDEEPGGR